MAYGDGVVSNQDVFHYEPYDALAFRDTQRISSTVEPREERGEGFCQAKEGRLIIGVVSNGLQLSAERLFALAEGRHTLPQLFHRHQCFLVSAEQAFDALVNMR